jgi:hypothetical protein
MGFKSFLEGMNVAPEAAKVLGEAHAGVIEAFGLKSVRAREVAALVVVRLAARRSGLDSNELRDEAIAQIQGARSPRELAFVRQRRSPGRAANAASQNVRILLNTPDRSRARDVNSVGLE